MDIGAHGAKVIGELRIGAIHTARAVKIASHQDPCAIRQARRAAPRRHLIAPGGSGIIVRDRAHAVLSAGSFDGAAVSVRTARAPARVTLGVAIHPANTRSTAVPGIHVSRPIPVAAIMKQYPSVARPSHLPRYHGSLNCGSGRVITQKINASQSNRPGTPCSSMMRPYSFSSTTGLRNSGERKYGMLVPPPPSPLPKGYSSANSKKLLFILLETRFLTSPVFSSVTNRCIRGLTATNVPTTASNAIQPNHGKFLKRPEKVPAIARRNSIVAQLRDAERNTPSADAPIAINRNLRRHPPRRSCSIAPSKRGRLIAISPP